MKPTVRIYDGIFSHSHGMTLGQENDAPPSLFEWERHPLPKDGGPPYAPISVFTETHMSAGAEADCVRIGLLVEASTLHPENYDLAWRLRDRYTAIFTHYQPFIESGKPFIYYPFGGSWIKEWGVFKKTKMVSLVVSKKHQMDGHKLRHSIAEQFFEFPAYDNVFGEPYSTSFVSKSEPLRDYRYSIVVENEKQNFWFTEKLIDCFSQGTVPIYWGCPAIGNFFDTRGFIQFNLISDLRDIMSRLSERDYSYRLPYIKTNMELARTYSCSEDWIARNHGNLLGLP